MSTTPTPVRVAVAGCGRIARVHCRYLAQLPNVRLVAACDSVEAAVTSLGRDFRIRQQFCDLEQMLREVGPDAVHVLTPPATHAEVATAALAAGAHVLVEKPMALRGTEADRMVAAAARAQRTLAVDHNRWFDPAVQRAVDLWKRGHLGELVGVDVFQGAAVEEAQALVRGSKKHWKTDLPGGVMHDVAVHPAYLLRNLVGPIAKLTAVSVCEGGALQEIRALVQGERCPGTMTISLRARPFMNGLQLLGTRATIAVNLNNMTLVVRRPHRLPKLLGKVVPNVEEMVQLLGATFWNTVAFASGRQRFYPGIGAVISRFYRHLTAGTPPPTTGDEGREVVRLLDALWQQGPEEQRLQISA